MQHYQINLWGRVVKLLLIIRKQLFLKIALQTYFRKTNLNVKFELDCFQFWKFEGNKKYGRFQIQKKLSDFCI